MSNAHEILASHPSGIIFLSPEHRAYRIRFRLAPVYQVKLTLCECVNASQGKTWTKLVGDSSESIGRFIVIRAKDCGWLSVQILDTHRSADRTNMESWLADRGLRAEDIAKLFRQAEKTGQAALTVSRLHEPPNS